MSMSIKCRGKSWSKWAPTAIEDDSDITPRDNGFMRFPTTTSNIDLILKRNEFRLNGFVGTQWNSSKVSLMERDRLSPRHLDSQ